MLNVQQMIRINLLPATEQTEVRIKVPSIASFAPIAVLCAAIGVLALISILQSVRLRSVHSQITALETEARQLAPLIQRIDQLTRERELARKRLTVIEKLDQERLVRVRLVDELSRRLPDYVWFTGFNEKSGEITLNGVTFSNLTVAELIRSLERSVLYEQVDLTISQRGQIEGHDVVNFTLTARRQTQPDPEPVEPSVHEIDVAPTVPGAGGKASPGA